MARTLKLVDSGGVLSDISFIDTAAIIGTKGKLIHAPIAGDLIVREASLGQTVGEDIRVNVYSDDQNAAATKIQNLTNMLRKAKQYDPSRWQTAPVYLQAQHNTETGIRYAIVSTPDEFSHPDLFDSPFETDSRIDDLGLSFTREHPWRGSVPGTLPSALTLTKVDGSANKATIHVPSIWHASPATHLFNFDALPAWSTNQVAATGITLWSVSGSTPAAGDIVYIGWDARPGFHFVIPIATAGNFSADIVAEFWNGSAWTALTAGSTYGFLSPALAASLEDTLFQSVGEWLLTASPGSTWATTAINGVTAFWVRLRLNTVTSWTTTPVSHGTETPYTPRKPYFILPSTATAGDSQPRLHFRYQMPSGALNATPGMGALSKIIVAARGKRPITNFTSHLQLHQYGLPASWARTLGTDTTEGDDLRAVEGKRTVCSFATDATMVSRLLLTGTNFFDDYEGLFRAFVVLEQTGGAVGDINVKLRIWQGANSAGSPWRETQEASPQAVDGGYEILELPGLIRVPFGDRAPGDTLTADILLDIMAERISGSGQLRLSFIALMPADEFYDELDDSDIDTANGGSALKHAAYVDSDFGVLVERAIKVAGGVPSNPWLRNSSIQRLEPATEYRIYMLQGHYKTSFGTGPFILTAGNALSVQMRAVNSYLILRGGA